MLGKFYPFHAGHQALVRAAAARCERVTVQVLASSVESIPLDVRAAWVREEHPDVRVVAAMDEAEVDFDSPAAWDAHMPLIRDLLDEPVDAVLTSDPYGEELARRLDASWVQVDPGRVGTPVSGTAVRADVAGHWWALPSPVRAWFVRRVVVVGAESTGTTTLSHALADHLGDAAGCRSSAGSGARSAPAGWPRRGTPPSSTSSPASRRDGRTTPRGRHRARSWCATPTCSPPRSGTSATSGRRRRR